MEFFQERAIYVGGNQMVDHVDGGGKKDLAVGVTGGQGDGFGKHGFAGTGVADEDQILFAGDEIEAQ